MSELNQASILSMAKNLCVHDCLIMMYQLENHLNIIQTFSTNIYIDNLKVQHQQSQPKYFDIKFRQMHKNIRMHTQKYIYACVTSYNEGEMFFFMLEFNYIIFVFIISVYSIFSTEKVNGENFCYQSLISYLQLCIQNITCSKVIVTSICSKQLQLQ